MSLFKVIVDSLIMTEKYLMVEMSAARDAFELSEIYYIRWLRTNSTLSNGLTKLGMCYAMQEFLHNHKIYATVTTVINTRSCVSRPIWMISSNPKKN